MLNVTFEIFILHYTMEYVGNIFIIVVSVKLLHVYLTVQYYKKYFVVHVLSLMVNIYDKSK